MKEQNQNTFNKILFKNYISLVLVITISVTILYMGINVSTTLQMYKQNMLNTLKQAQININNQTQLMEEYLSTTQISLIADSDFQEFLNMPSTLLINSINDTLFSVDLFKNNIDSIHVFLQDDNLLPSYTHNNPYHNSIFSLKSVQNEFWYTKTVQNQGFTHFFIDTATFDQPTLCASRVLYDIKNMPKVLGTIKANVSLNSFMRHLENISFEKMGAAFIQSGGEIMYVPKNILINLSPAKSNFWQTIITLPVVASQWTLTGVINNRELYRQSLLEVFPITLILVIAILFAILLSKKSSKKISAPIYELCLRMNEMDHATIVNLANCTEIMQLYTTYNTMLDKSKELIRSKEAAVLKYKQAELKALQSQLNPHFIYNTLASISTLIDIGDTKNADAAITYLGSFLRSSLNNGNTYISLEKELEQVTAYFEIQRLRFSNTIELQIEAPTIIPQYSITKLLLQPLVENCIIHGFTGLDTIGKITISVIETPEKLILQVADNGWGTDIENLNTLVEIGSLYSEDNDDFYCIQNVFQRLKNCYGSNASLKYEENSHGGVTAIIEISTKVLSRSN